MPDPTRKTISASNAAALFDASPYVTRWMLWQYFKNQLPIGGTEDARMSWGTKMQPLLIDQARQDLGVQTWPNPQDRYARRNQLGCTRDAKIIDPDRGPAALETKCVFDYRQWMERWDGGKRPPVDIEIQLQTQMYVGQDGKPWQWGVIATWVCGEMKYFERKAQPALWAELEDRAALFFQSLEANDEPDPFGSPDEVPLLAELYPSIEREEQEIHDVEMAEIARMFEWHRAKASLHAKARDEYKAKVLAMTGDCAVTRLPGTLVEVSKSTTPAKVVSFEDVAQLQTNVGKEIRAASVRNNIKVIEFDEAPPPPPESLTAAG